MVLANLVRNLCTPPVIIKFSDVAKDKIFTKVRRTTLLMLLEMIGLVGKGDRLLQYLLVHTICF